MSGNHKIIVLFYLSFFYCFLCLVVISFMYGDFVLFILAFVFFIVLFSILKDGKTYKIERFNDLDDGIHR